jgi:FxLD family lantipeptide
MTMPIRAASGAIDERTDRAQLDVLDEFDLDVRVTTDAAAGYALRRCDTSDGCGSTCASACSSN